MANQIFKDATLYFYRLTPTLATVIPAMDHIDETLTFPSLNSYYEPAIRMALGLAKKVLYSAMDQSEVYHITMGM